MFYPHVMISAAQASKSDDLRHALLPFSLFLSGICEATKDRSGASSKKREKKEHLIWDSQGCRPWTETQQQSDYMFMHKKHSDHGRKSENKWRFGSHACFSLQCANSTSQRFDQTVYGLKMLLFQCGCVFISVVYLYIFSVCVCACVCVCVSDSESLCSDCEQLTGRGVIFGGPLRLLRKLIRLILHQFNPPV